MQTEGPPTARPTPTHADLERAIVSVPGVAEAQVTRVEETGKSRLRIRLANDEDAEAVSWAIAATLRERFGISLDPEQIRPRPGSIPVADRGDASPGSEGGDASPVSEGGDATSEAADDGGSEVPSDPAGRPAVPGSGPGAAGGSGDRALHEADEEDTSDELAISGDRVLLSDAARALLEEAVAEARRAEVDPQDDDATLAGAPAGGAAPPDEPVHPTSDADDAATVTPLRSAAPVRDDGVRARIRHLDTRVRVSDVEVTATLAFGSREVTGSAHSVATEQGILRAVAEATLNALSELTGDRLVAGIDSVAASVAGDPPIASVVVSLLTDRGDEALLGSSLVRNDPDRAIMRATLDAVNRRVEPWLEVDLAG